MGNSHEGFQYGFTVGAISGAIAGTTNNILSAFDHQKALYNSNPTGYFLDFFIDKEAMLAPLTGGAPSWAGTAELFIIARALPKKD